MSTSKCPYGCGPLQLTAEDRTKTSGRSPCDAGVFFDWTQEVRENSDAVRIDKLGNALRDISFKVSGGDGHPTQSESQD